MTNGTQGKFYSHRLSFISMHGKKALGSVGKLGFKRIWINFTNTVCASMLSFCYWLALNLRVIKVVVVQLWSRVLSFATPWAAAHTLLRPWDFPGKNTGVGSHFLLQGIFLTQGSNSGLPHCRQILYCLRHQGIPDCMRPTHVMEGNLPHLKKI